jgi:hypothetical protein
MLQRRRTDIQIVIKTIFVISGALNIGKQIFLARLIQTNYSEKPACCGNFAGKFLKRLLN